MIFSQHAQHAYCFSPEIKKTAITTITVICFHIRFWEFGYMKIICKCLCSIYNRWSWGDFGEVCGDSFMWDWKFSGRLGWLQWICLALELYTANTVGNKQKQGRRTMIILWSRIESILAKTCQQRSWMLRCLDKLRPVSLAWTMKGFHFTKEGMAHTAPKLGHVEKTWNSACQRLSGCIRSFKVYQTIAIFQSTADLNLNSASLPGKEPMMRMTLELSIDMPVTKLVRRIGLSTDWKADCGTLIQLFVLFVLFTWKGSQSCPDRVTCADLWLRKVNSLDEAFGKSDETKQKESVPLISKAWQSVAKETRWSMIYLSHFDKNLTTVC